VADPTPATPRPVAVKAADGLMRSVFGRDWQTGCTRPRLKERERKRDRWAEIIDAEFRPILDGMAEALVPFAKFCDGIGRVGPTDDVLLAYSMDTGRIEFRYSDCAKARAALARAGYSE